jgi:hypothetical protein
MENKIKEIVNRIISKHLNDPSKIADFEEMEIVLSESESKTINVLNNLPLDILEWVSSTFDELSYKFRSIEFINCLEELIIKFPESSIIKQDVKVAKAIYYESLEDDEA